MPLPLLLENHIIKSKERYNRIIQHLKKCVHFADKTTLEEKEEIFALSNSKGISNEKRPASPYDTISNSSKSSSTRKVIVRSSSYGPLDNYAVRPLSQQDYEKFEILLLRLTISCGIAFHWVNNPETKELFQFLNPHLKLPDCRILGGRVLKAAVSEKDKIMNEELC
ncbi:hypothetical protein C2G38_2225111 [Gigaspora rosea]|uniref:Uncharacterized protein n=1 Tax=Gigaspora rosea TaxID=44941 RepID=A0A397U174_9GLOM|nr:hypothetical protein C2G38_2225111 [Gigaspora rosea]